MIPIAELLDPTERQPLWPLLQQIGVRHAVSLLEAGEQRSRWLREESHADKRSLLGLAPGEPCWGARGIDRLQGALRGGGLRARRDRGHTPLDRVRLGMTGREEQLDAFCDQLRAMGAAGVPVRCYNWISVYSWARTGIAVPARGGALTTEYDHAAMSAAPPPARGGARERAARCGRTSSTSSSASSPSPRRRACSSRCTRTTRRSRPCAASGASCAPSRPSSACSSSCRASATASRCARAISR